MTQNPLVFRFAVIFAITISYQAVASSHGLTKLLLDGERTYEGALTWSDGETAIMTRFVDQAGQVFGTATYPDGEILELSLVENEATSYLFKWDYASEHYGYALFTFSDDYATFKGTWGHGDSYADGGEWIGIVESGRTQSDSVQAIQFKNTGLVGSWRSPDGDRYDILDGFKPNSGGVILYENGEASGVDTWNLNSSTKVLEIGWTQAPVEISADGQFLIWGHDFAKTTYQKIADVETDVVSTLKDDQDAFLDELTTFTWASYAPEINRVEFTKTFSTTEGVISQFSNDGSIDSLSSWGVASGVLKLADVVYIEARMTNSYLIAMDADEEFIVLRREDTKQQAVRTELQAAREAFLRELTTGAWLQPSYIGSYVYRFRPLHSDLKGLKFGESDNKLQSMEVWEYSVATGAIQIGYSEFIGGLVEGDLLVFVDGDGEQAIYHRDSSTEKKHFTTADTKSISISERTASSVSEIIGRQLAQDDTFFLFEFSTDGRTGYLHEWTSTPFQITGESLELDDYNTYEKVYLIEDYVTLGEERGFKIDTRKTRLRPKTDLESESDADQAKDSLQAIQEGGVKLLIMRTDGTTEKVRLPLKSFNELKSINLQME